MRKILCIVLALNLILLLGVALANVGTKALRLPTPTVPSFAYYGAAEPDGITVGEMMLILGDPTNAEYYPANIDIYWGSTEIDVPANRFSPYSKVDFYSEGDHAPLDTPWLGFLSVR